MNRKVYDVFMFFNEVDLLEIRLNTLNELVDKFIITEANTTQMGEPHELCFLKEKDRFAQFSDKIVYNVVDTASLSFDSQWEREIYQKNHTIPENLQIRDEDIIIFSDLDEIPNPDKVKEVISLFDDNVIYHFAQRMFYFYVNYEDISHQLLASCGEFSEISASEKRWLGTKMCSYKILKRYTADGLRQKERLDNRAIRIADGGWHFSYMGGSSQAALDRIREKLKAFSHATDLNKFRYKNAVIIWWKIKRGKDLFGRKAQFKKVEMKELEYPDFLIKNQGKYEHLIKK